MRGLRSDHLHWIQIGVNCRQFQVISVQVYSPIRSRFNIAGPSFTSIYISLSTRFLFSVRPIHVVGTSDLASVLLLLDGFPGVPLRISVYFAGNWLNMIGMVRNYLSTSLHHVERYVWGNSGNGGARNLGASLEIYLRCTISIRKVRDVTSEDGCCGTLRK